MSTTEDFISSVSRTTEFPWYRETIGTKLTPQCRDVLINYSKIPEESIEKHVYVVRDYAWSLFPFPCIGGFSFLSLRLSKHPRYKELHDRMKASDDKLLDIGTCVGQDLRKLAYDGVNPANLYGTDLISGYEEAGFRLFNDRDRFKNHFFAADILSNDEDSHLIRRRGEWNILTASLFLHVFNLPSAKVACRRMLDLAAGPGSWIVGVQTASIEPGELKIGPPFVKEGETRTTYRHSKETFAQMWKEVAMDAGKKIEIWAEYDEESLEGVAAERYFSGTHVRDMWFWIVVLD